MTAATQITKAPATMSWRWTAAAAMPAPREMVPVNGPIADALLRSVAFDLEVLERRGSAADHARYLDGLRAVLRREEGRRDLF